MTTTADHHDEPPAGRVVPLHRDRPTAPDPEAHPPGGRAQTWLARTVAPLPSTAQLRQAARWWSRDGARGLAAWLLWSPVLLLREVAGPVRVGLVRALAAWVAWVSLPDYAAAAKDAVGDARAKHAERVELRRSARRRMSVLLALAAAGAVWWAATTRPLLLVPVGLLAVCALDALGRRRDTDTPLPGPKRTVLAEGVPLRQLTASVLDVLDQQVDTPDAFGVDRPMVWDQGRQEYILRVSSTFRIDPDHLRAVERHIGAADYAVRCLPTDTATVRELRIRRGDPLAHVPPPPPLEPGSSSVADPLEVGVSLSEVPLALSLAGVHVGLVGATGAGKSKSALWAIIDRLSVCRDAVIWGVDLARGPALPMWRGVIQRAAYTIPDAERLLAAAIAEIDRRMTVLTAIAEDDDPDNDVDEWHSGLGPALVVVVDEFALLAEQDGKTGRADLLGMAQQIIRTGRKVWVSLIMGTQKTGNSDFGSAVMQTQVGVWVLMACAERDTVHTVGVERRDRGWTPHHLLPAVEGDTRDAGKAFVLAPAHRTPDLYRFFAPLPVSEVKRRARQRETAGLPRLHDTTSAGESEAVVVPAVLAAVEAAFAARGNPERLSTAELVAWLRERHDPTINEKGLALALRPLGVQRARSRWRPTPDANAVRGYLRADVEAALRRL